MEQKDYKAIAKMIYSQIHTIGHPVSKGTEFELGKLAQRLADYFEKEDELIKAERLKLARDEPSFENDYNLFDEGFNKEQFLKDCEVGK